MDASVVAPVDVAERRPFDVLDVARGSLAIDQITRAMTSRATNRLNQRVMSRLGQPVFFDHQRRHYNSSRACRSAESELPTHRRLRSHHDQCVVDEAMFAVLQGWHLAETEDPLHESHFAG